MNVSNSKSCLHCIDAAVLRADENKVNNTSCYTYFYKSHYVFFLISLEKRAWISFLVFRFDDLHIIPCLNFVF